MQEIKTIGVIGHRGMVGGAVYKYFKDNEYETYGYSKSDQSEKDKVNQADVIFVCVSTPFNWYKNVFEIGNVEAVIHEITGSRIVVIKSTVPIGTTERIQSEHSDLKILFNPEFLSETTAYGDFVNPDRQFVGYTKLSYPEAISVLNLLPESAYGVIMPSREAELLKYINNLHGFLSVIEFNHYYDVCQKEGLNYERVVKAAEASKWLGAPMGKQYHKIFHKGYRGLGGACFPKDMASWIEYTEKMGIPNGIMKMARDTNKELLKAQNLTEAEVEKA